MSYYYDDEDRAVIDSLMKDVDRKIDTVEELLDGGFFSDDVEDDLSLLHATIKVLGYYMHTQAFEKWYEPYEARISAIYNQLSYEDVDSQATVTNIRDNPDGSAFVEVEMDAGMERATMDAGINMLLIRGILECTTDELFVWAQQGKKNAK